MFIIGVILFTLFALFGAFVLVMQSSWGRQKMVSMLTEALQDSGWSVEIKETSGTLPHEIGLNRVTIQSPRGDIVTIQSIQTEISLFDLLRKEIAFTKFYADQIEWTPGKENANGSVQEEPKAAGIPFIIYFSDLRLTRVLLPHWLKNIDVAGQIKIGRNNRMAYAKLSAQLSDIPENRASIELRIHPNKQTQIKLDLTAPSMTELSSIDYPLKAKGDIHLYAKGKWDAFSGLIFGSETFSSIKGMVQGSIQIETIALSDPAKSLLDGQWRLTSAIERMPNQEIRFFNISANGDAIQTRGHLIVYPNGQLKDASLLVSMEDLRKTQIPTLEGTLAADLKLTRWVQGTVTLHSPLVKWKNHKAENLFLVLRTEKEMENWGANLDMKATILEHVWDAKCDLLWKIGHSLKIDDLVIFSPLASVDGNLEIFSNQLLAGELRTQIGNLHNFDIPLYGAIDTTVRLKIDETQKILQQTAEIDAKTLDFYYDDMQIQKAFFYADLSGTIDQPSGHAYIEIQQAQWKNLYLETGAIETTSAGNEWPFFFRAEGDWREPFELVFNGFWHSQQSHFFLHLQNLTGSLFSRPITLGSHTEFEIGPDTLAVDHFAISIGNANLQTSIDHQS